MDSNTNCPPRRGRSGDNNHWYSSTYWRSNRHKFNNTTVGRSPHHSIPENDISIHSMLSINKSDHNFNSSKAADNLNVVIQSDGYSFRRRSYTEPNPRLDSRQSVKRSNDCIERTESQKRLRMRDPFESPNSMVKDFRLTQTNGNKSVDSFNDLFCQSCQTQCQSSLDYSNHLSGRRHKINLESTERLKQTDDCNQLHRLLKLSKEPVVGLNYIKETRQEHFTCDLCKCYEMTVNNTVQHIRGYRHQRNFMAQKETDDRMKRSVERQKRHSEKRSVCSATQTCDNLHEEDRTRTPRSRSSRSDRTDTQIITESDFEKFDSCKKTIENFRTIREICDQMIGYFSEKQKSSANMSPKNRSLTAQTFECLASKIKREN